VCVEWEVAVQLATIDDVVVALDDIIARARDENSRLGYFPALYRRVTVEVGNGIERGAFEDGERMEAFDVLFAGRYIDAYQRFLSGERVTGSWAVAFRAAQDRRPIVVQHLVFGMNAHINLDLGIAAARIAPGRALPGLRRDFEEINAILKSLVDDVEERLAGVWPWLRPLDWLAGGLDERLAGFSMEVARDHAWRFAEQLASLDEAGQEEQIARVDDWIEAFGMRLWHPSRWLSLPLALVRLGERGSVQSIIGELGRTRVG
jgi:hypothetical protein